MKILTLGAMALSLLPIMAAVLLLAGRLDLGPTAPWHLLLMVDTGQIGFVEMLALCLLGGSLVGLAALAISPARVQRPGRIYDPAIRPG